MSNLFFSCRINLSYFFKVITTAITAVTTNPDEFITALSHKGLLGKRDVGTSSLLWRLISPVLFTFKILAFEFSS